MANGQSKIQITITAVDKATAQILRINNSLAKMAPQYKRLGASISHFSKAAGLNKMGMQLRSVAQHAATVGRQIANATQQMAAFVGIGSIAAIGAIAVEWGRLGFQIAQTSNLIGVGTSYLQQLRAAATMTGVSADSASEALKAMGNTLEDAVTGRNQQALVMMNRLGIYLHRTATGAVDTERAMEDLADRLNDPAFKGNRQAQAFVARQFGAEAMLPYLLMSKQQRAGYRAESLQTGATQNPGNIASAAAFGTVLFRAESAATGLKNTIGNALIPVLQPLLEKFIAWEQQNKDIIGSGIASFVSNLASGIGTIAKGVDAAAQAMGGWKNVMIGLGAIIILNAVGPTLRLGWALASLSVSFIPATIRALALLGSAFGAYAGSAATAAEASALGLAAGGAATLVPLGIAGATGYGIGSLFNKTWDWASGGRSSYGTWNYDLAHPGDRSDYMNNPGNLKNPGGSGFQRFPSRQAGLLGLASQLRRYGARGLNTIDSIIPTYSPASDGNDPGTEIPQIASWTGFKHDQALDFDNPSTLATFMKGIIRKENAEGVGSAYQMPDILAAAKQAVQVDVQVHDHRVTTKVTHSPRTNEAMPSGNLP